MSKHLRFSIDPVTMVAHNRAIKDHIYVIEIGALDDLRAERDAIARNSLEMSKEFWAMKDENDCFRQALELIADDNMFSKLLGHDATAREALKRKTSE